MGNGYVCTVPKFERFGFLYLLCVRAELLKQF